jgi:hypothetical protein
VFEGDTPSESRSLRTLASTSKLFCHDMHLLECDGCANYLQQFRVTVTTVGRIHGDDLDPGYRARLLSAFKDWH